LEKVSRETLAQLTLFTPILFQLLSEHVLKQKFNPKYAEFAFSKCSDFGSLGFVRFSLHTSAGFGGKRPIIFLPLTSGNLSTLCVYPPPHSTPKILLA